MCTTYTICTPAGQGQVHMMVIGCAPQIYIAHPISGSVVQLLPLTYL